jgi:hypothetical protein
VSEIEQMASTHLFDPTTMKLWVYTWFHDQSDGPEPATPVGKVVAQAAIFHIYEDQVPKGLFRKLNQIWPLPPRTWKL